MAVSTTCGRHLVFARLILKNSAEFFKSYVSAHTCAVHDIYYMATIVCAVQLAAERARFPFNDRALLALCPRHIQPVFDLIVDIHVRVN